MDLTELIKESQTFDQPCKFAGNCNGHSIYCNSEAKSAPRKCTHRIYPDNMKNCHLFSKNIVESEEFINLQKDLMLHKKLYYEFNTPNISDYEYDMLERKSFKMAQELGFRADSFEDPEENEAHHVHWMVGYKEDSVYNN